MRYKFPHNIGLFLQLIILIQRTSAGPPLWSYLSDLCPPGLTAVTSNHKVRTCTSACPRTARCIQGICCDRLPQCANLTYRYATGYVCMAGYKQTCPPSTRCMPSSRPGQSVCCANRKGTVLPRKSTVRNTFRKIGAGHAVTSVLGRTLAWTTPRPQLKICPASHPIVGRTPGGGLQLCKDCTRGMCYPFPKSSAMLCCHTVLSLCASGQVEIESGFAKDCSRDRCGLGFECRSTDGLMLCCGHPKCRNGEKATRVCGGGCSSGERCEYIDDERWCCPYQEVESQTVIQQMCPGSLRPVSYCSSSNPRCPDGMVCVAPENSNKFICCEDPATISIERLLERITANQAVYRRRNSKSLTSEVSGNPRSRGLTMAPLTMTSSSSTRPSWPIKLSMKLQTTSNPREFKMTTVRAGTFKPNREWTSTQSVIGVQPSDVRCIREGSPMQYEGVPMKCPELGAPCPKAGYICQETNTRFLYCCPLEGIDKEDGEERKSITNEITNEVSTRKPRPVLPWLDKMPTTSESPTTTTALQTMVEPKCPPNQHHTVIEANGNIWNCTGWLDFTCPVGYLCVASTTNLSFLCCQADIFSG